MTKKMVSNMMQLSKATATATSVVTVLCYATEDELSNATADYLDGMLALAKEMSIHADIIYDAVVNGRDDMDETAKMYIKASKGETSRRDR